MPYFFIAINVSLMTVGQLFFKQSAIYVNVHTNLNLLTKYLFNPWFYGAIFFFGLATLTWVQILTTMKLSIAYPILSISYILTAIGAYYFFGEKLNVVNLIGMFLIMGGVSLVSVK